MSTVDRSQHVMEAVSRDLRRIAGVVDEEIREAAGEPVAFTLFVWTKGRCSYISSATERGEIITVLGAMIARWKAGEADIPAHLARPDQ
ncbi:MAG: hypothetical protein J0I54_20465 [Bosea sp.]|uniref:hypothetical protein n=1 Tax=unclassified Bosea (in: a-proteobacteria) TaxID=2653178 RepID=UPI001AC9F40B|nr:MULTISPECIES: hypothetical protein [unclassified Bosea (in: a-proteobacteria)]MBN9459013.1 hypothetical protein [Bosea sp. (in: a-proteobacteria)]